MCRVKSSLSGAAFIEPIVTHTMESIGTGRGERSVWGRRTPLFIILLEKSLHEAMIVKKSPGVSTTEINATRLRM